MKRTIKIFAVLVIFFVLFAFSGASLARGSSFENGVTYFEPMNSTWKTFAMNFYKKEFSKNLPKGVKFQIVESSDGSGVAIHIIVPQWYNAKDMKNLDAIDDMIFNKLNIAWMNSTKKPGSGSYNNKIGVNTYSMYTQHNKLTGTAYHYYAYQTALGTSMNTDVYWYDYIAYQKVTMQGISDVWISQPMIGYEGLTVRDDLHAWGTSVSVSIPPSGEITESTTTFTDSCNAPYTRDVFNFPMWTRYAASFIRAGQDQYGFVHYTFGSEQITDSVQIYKGVTY